LFTIVVARNAKALPARTSARVTEQVAQV
jgi:hypothetical protein